MAGTVLTNKATFKCAHMAAPVGIAGGITISSLGTHLTINGALPITAGATIAGFTSVLCLYAPGGTPTPCVSFILTAPSETRLVVDGKTVYTTLDAPAVALVPSSGNVIPGLVITDPETLVSAT